MNRQVRINRRLPSAKQQIQTLKRSLHGHANKLSHMAPPQVTKRPWYPLVIDIVIPTAGNEVFYSPSDLINSLTTQLGLPSQASSILNMKVSRIDAYSIGTGASTDRPAISMDVSSVTPSIGDPTTPGNAEVFYSIIKKLTDQGNLSESAKVSYSYPRHMSDQPLSSQSGFSIFSVAGNQANTAVRVHCHWASTDTAATL
jgi:hypothetical protein